MKRYEIIKHLIEKRGYQSYLEIGVLGNETFNALPSLKIKHSVDPNGLATYNMPSDEFFEEFCHLKYDIVFIDGLHLAEQVARDIENSLTHLNEGGIIVVHDCLPAAEWEQFREGLSGKPWTGDVWKTFAAMRADRDDLMMCVVDTDCGCGLIEKKRYKQGLNTEAMKLELTWDFFVANRNTMMGVITVEEFLGRY